MPRLCVVFSLAGCLAAQLTYLTQQPGSWKPWKLSAVASARAGRGVTPVELKAFESKLIELSEFARRAPGIGEPVGFSVETWGNLAGYRQRPGQPAGKQLPLSGALNFGAFPIVEYLRNGKITRTDTGETYLLLFTINDLQAVNRSRPPEWGQLETDAVMMPAATGTVAGFPLISGNVVIKKNPKPLTVPLPLAQAMQLVLTDLKSAFETSRAGLAKEQAEFAEWQTPAKREERRKGYRYASDVNKDGGAFARQMEGQEVEIEAALRANVAPNGPSAKSVQEAESKLKEVEVLLAALTPAEAASPSCYDESGDKFAQRFRVAGPPACVPLVRPNWNYFDPRLPRSAPQLIVVGSYDNCLKSRESTVGKPWGCGANRKLMEGMDWPGVVNWLDR